MLKKNKQILQDVSKIDAYLKLKKIKALKEKENSGTKEAADSAMKSPPKETSDSNEALEDYRVLKENILEMTSSRIDFSLLFEERKVAYQKVAIRNRR